MLVEIEEVTAILIDLVITEAIECTIEQNDVILFYDRINILNHGRPFLGPC